MHMLDFLQSGAGNLVVSVQKNKNEST